MKRVPCDGPFYFLGVSWNKPKKWIDGIPTFAEEKPRLASIGIRIDDGMLVEVHVPEGWTYEEWSAGYMLSAVIFYDQKGGRRATLHADHFGTDSAYIVHFKPHTRFIPSAAYYGPGQRVEVLDGRHHSVAHTVPYIAPPDMLLPEASNDARIIAEQWLDAVYPRWRDSAAYWDE